MDELKPVFADAEIVAIMDAKDQRIDAQREMIKELYIVAARSLSILDILYLCDTLQADLNTAIAKAKELTK